MAQQRHCNTFVKTRSKLACLISLFSAHAFATAPLVAIDEVQPWQDGLFEVLNCQVSVPFTTTLSAESSAKLTQLLPKGSEVKKGQLVAKQQDFYFQQELTRLRQELTLQLAKFNYHKDEFTRLLALENTLVSATQLDKARLAKQTAEIQYQQLQSQINELTHRINKLAYYAPADGIVINNFSEPGKYLQQGDKVLSFLSPADKELTCQVPVATFNQFGDASYQLSTNMAMPLKFARVEHSIARTSQFVQVYLTPTAAPLPYFLGERIKVTMRMANSTLTKLPADSVNLTSAGNYVWQVNEENRVTKVNITLHKNMSDFFIVESTLKAGDKIVTLGKSKLKPNQQVALQIQREVL